MAPSTTWDSSFQERLTTNLVASSICPVQLGLPEILASRVRSCFDVAWCRPSFYGGGEKTDTRGSYSDPACCCDPPEVECPGTISLRWKG